MLTFSVIPKTSFSTGFKVIANPTQQPAPTPEKPNPIGVKTRSGENFWCLFFIDKYVRLTRFIDFENYIVTKVMSQKFFDGQEPMIKAQSENIFSRPTNFLKRSKKPLSKE